MNLEDYCNFRVNKNKKLVLGITSGRSGMKWFLDIMRSHKGVEGGAERDVEYEAVYRYTKHYKLPINVAPVFNKIRSSIVGDWIKNEISVVVSPYLSLGLEEVIAELSPDYIVWGIAEPFFTVTSFVNKRVYEKDVSDRYGRDGLRPFPLIDPGLSMHQNIGRICPWPLRSDWNQLTSAVKSAWFINYIHTTIYSSLIEINIPVWLFDLQECDQNFDFYLKLMQDFNLEPSLSKKKFYRIKTKGSGLITRPYRRAENKPLRLSSEERLLVASELSEYQGLYDALKNHSGWLNLSKTVSLSG